MCEVVSKNITLKKHVHFFIPLFWNEKLSLTPNIIWNPKTESSVYPWHMQYLT